MDCFSHLFCCFILFLLNLFTVTGYDDLSSVVIAPTGPVVALKGNTITLTCRVDSLAQSPVLQWLPHPNADFSDTFHNRYTQVWNDPYLVLTIKSVQHEDAGIFICQSENYGKDTVRVYVYGPKTNSTVCGHSQYRCPSSGVCIYQRYRCDYVQDCDDGSDERHCDSTCEGQFRCASGQCVQREYVCDKFASEDCRDGSDEQDCGRIGYGADVDLEYKTTVPPKTIHYSHSWNFNAIYSGVASIIGVVCVGAIIVITMCRIHMRREALRRANRYLHSAHLGARSPPPPPPLHPGSARGYPWQHRTTSAHNYTSALYHVPDENTDMDVIPYRCPNQRLLDVNINLRFTPEGEPEFTSSTNAMTGLIAKPPSYSELCSNTLISGDPPPREGTPPPPYSTLPHTHVISDYTDAVPPYQPTPPTTAVVSRTRASTTRAVQPIPSTGSGSSVANNTNNIGANSSIEYTTPHTSDIPSSGANVTGPSVTATSASNSVDRHGIR